MCAASSSRTALAWVKSLIQKSNFIKSKTLICVQCHTYEEKSRPCFFNLGFSHKDLQQVVITELDGEDSPVAQAKRKCA